MPQRYDVSSNPTNFWDKLRENVMNGNKKPPTPCNIQSLGGFYPTIYVFSVAILLFQQLLEGCVLTHLALLVNMLLHFCHVITHSFELHSSSHQIELVQTSHIAVESLFRAWLQTLVHQGIIDT